MGVGVVGMGTVTAHRRAAERRATSDNPRHETWIHFFSFIIRQITDVRTLLPRARGGGL